MNANIENQTSYEHIKIVHNSKEYLLKSGETISLSVEDNNSKIKLYVSEKNNVLINWLFALFDGMVHEESVVNSLICDTSFNILPSQTNAKLILKDLQYRDDNNGFIYDSVFVDCDENVITNLSYELTDTTKARKKSLFYYICIVSWMPVLILLLILSLLTGDIGFIFAGVIVLLCFSVPGWKKAYKTKKYYSSEYANEVLLSQFNKQKANSGNPVVPEPKGLLDKFLHKILDFIFKRK